MIRKMIVAGFSGMLLLSGCSSQPSKEGTFQPQVEPVMPAERAAGEYGLPMHSEQSGGVEVIPIDQQEAASGVALDAPMSMDASQDNQLDIAYEPIVYFGYDSDVVSEEGRAVLKYYAEKLQAQPDVRVKLEGHTDERGSPEYNLALGERRAKAVAEVLMLYGVSPERIDVVSYGEARPAVEGHDETAWSKNRRVELVFIQ
jgi:peptidoglycan-associated lipoprotein